MIDFLSSIFPFVIVCLGSFVIFLGVYTIIRKAIVDAFRQINREKEVDKRYFD